MSRRITRSSARSRAKTPPSGSDDDLPIVRSNNKTANGHATEDHVSTLEAHVSKVVQSARSLKQEYTQLQKKYEDLQVELADTKEQLEGEEQPRRGSKGAKKGPSVVQLQKTVVELKTRVRKLEKVRARDRKKIAKMEAREIKRDAEELQDQAEFDIGDNVYVMRKLLRNFHDLMLVNPLEESEECPICMSTMELGQATSLPCQHIFCTSCIEELLSISKRDNPANRYNENTTTTTPSISFPCPQCREKTDPDDMEVVEFTSATQWDALLEVAKKSAKLDRRRGDMDTSEEEEEEERVNGFIDDEESEGARSSVGDTEEDKHSSPEPVAGPSTLKGKRRLRVRTPSSEAEPELPAENGSAQAESPLTEPDEEQEENAQPDQDHNGEEAQAGPSNINVPSTPRGNRPIIDTARSFLQSPVSEKRRRLEELADARLEKAKRRRFG